MFQQTSARLDPSHATTHHVLGEWAFGVASISWVERRVAAALFATPPTVRAPLAFHGCLCMSSTVYLCSSRCLRVLVCVCGCRPRTRRRCCTTPTPKKHVRHSSWLCFVASAPSTPSHIAFYVLCCFVCARVRSAGVLLDEHPAHRGNAAPARPHSRCEGVDGQGVGHEAIA